MNLLTCEQASVNLRTRAGAAVSPLTRVQVGLHPCYRGRVIPEISEAERSLERV